MAALFMSASMPASACGRQSEITSDHGSTTPAAAVGLSRACSHRWQQVVNQREEDGEEEDYVELVEAGSDSSEALESAEEALDLVALTVAARVVGPGPTTFGLGRDDRLVAELSGEPPCAIALVGAVHEQGGAA